MLSKTTLAMGGVVIAIVSAAAGVAGSFLYLSKPFEKWQGQFSETYLPAQTWALKELREGKAEKALDYLEMSTTFSLLTMGQIRSEGGAPITDVQTTDSIRYLCDHPSKRSQDDAAHRVSIGEACALLLSP
ncbi:MAG TPA: hypothetical protein VFM48_12605 [Aquabacterium sp.]|nr:hypothetical protein [Aquabacterium sp.]